MGRVCSKFKDIDWFAVFFYIALTIFGIILLTRIFHGSGFMADTAEHIHASWLISKGKVPYRDFFEHHNPLLWYLFAPVTQLLGRNVNIIYIARSVAVIGWFAIFYQLYTITKDYFGGEKVARSALLFLVLAPVWFDGQNLRPDIFMLLFILSGIRRFFMYMDNKQRKNLMLSYLCWSVAFLFLQKTVIAGAGFTIANLWLLMKNKISWKDCIQAGIPALLLLSTVAGYFWSEDALGAWYKWNITFNWFLMDYIGFRILDVKFWTLWLRCWGILSLVLVFDHRLSGDKDIVLLFIFGFVAVSLLMCSPYSQYYISFFVLSAPYGGLAIRKFMAEDIQKKFVKQIIAECIFFYFCCLLWMYNLQGRKFIMWMNDVKEIIAKFSEKEIVMSGYQNDNLNLFNNDADYFWFNYKLLDNVQTDKFGKFDFNRVMKKVRPELLSITENATGYRYDFDWIRTNYEKKNWRQVLLSGGVEERMLRNKFRL